MVVFVELSQKPSDQTDPMIGSREARRQAFVVFVELSFKPSDRADPMIGSREARRQAIVVFMELSLKTIGSGRSDDRIGGRRWSFLQNCRSKHLDPVVPSAGSFRPRRNALSARWIRQ